MVDKLIYKTPLSQTGVRVMHLDLTNPLSYNSESLTGTSPTVTSSDASLVTTSSVAVNTGALTNDDSSTCEIGKGVQWTCTSVKSSTSKVLLRVAWAVAEGGSADTHEIELDLEPYVTE